MAKEVSYKAEEAGKRLDVFLVTYQPELSRSHIQKLIDQGAVLVDGQVRKANYKLRGGETVSLVIPEAEPVSVEPENIPLDVLYEDKDIIVINKPRGMVVHPAAGVHTGTLVNALLYHCHDLSGINGEIRPGIVHRLDKDTSGVLVCAKNDVAHLDLAEQISTKTAHRVYRAIVHGNIKEEAGIIKGDIGRHPTDRKKMAIVRENGKPAVTHFKVLERFGEYTLVECRLETGRTHQIRVHMTSIGHPLVNDPKYGPKKSSPFAIKGQALHSLSLTLNHPVTKEEMTFTAPLPQDMEKILTGLRNKMAKIK
ncbi:MAG: RluA family pseudouridine synthase [Selenomonas sp.]|jgi:23S rRNA pseudouridine1911/1915/1917 synthase|uniref:RluA family pseudouridine synthase n=1 Tax=Selenomonas sp. AE3005 TaxID=1485543 RepID=UPI0025DACA56|nr:RluA family pseudouridine synthase [Selenomonas sp. AE3005]MBQ1614383.1 RluA family pseudouridine synthase [Selenomonas sp.]MBQ1808250.1 RluA family pseudouridine synthase [Selenomonas sp.]MBQ1920457.1 RluA family pseudouridine synthase [Selenomonas sp.]MBQ2088516.1 RluA family pseudouridine synthase [Selenomonas sp.]MBQ4212089.1 RluA family pseudouridine synthase [Selenomonas sp.]